MRWLGMAMLALGLGVAAASAGRMGDPVLEARQAAAVGDEVTLPDTSERLGAWWQAGGIGWLLGVGLVVGGAVVARRADAAAVAEASAGGGTDLAAALDAIEAEVAEVRAVLDDPALAESPTTRDRLDLMHAHHIAPVVDARAELLSRHGMAAFASYFSPFSAAERQLGRAWSGLADGRVDVAVEALEDARVSLGQARAAWVRAG